MKRVDKEIENWIKPFATVIGGKIDVEENLREINPSKYFLRLTQPNNFESYAIALHSYWIYEKLHSSKILEKIKNFGYDLPEEDFEKLTWKKFYELKETEFDLNKAIYNSVNNKEPFIQMSNELYPGEGMMDIKHIENFVEIVNELYGNQEIELFFIFLTSDDLDKDSLYSGCIQDLLDFIEKNDSEYTPSLIYPKEKNWVVNTDYDLSFSTIAGESKLIKRLVNENKDEIIKIEY